MLRYLIDTDVFSAIARQTSAAAAARLDAIGSSSVGLSVITAAEIAFGRERRPIGDRLATRIDRLQRLLTPLPLLQQVVPHYARARTQLEQRGTPIGPNDLWLAAHALAEQLVVVTGNEQEFRRVPDLEVENWLR